MEKLDKNVDENKDNNHKNRNNQHVNHKTPYKPTCTQRKKHSYYWTHVGCAHDSSICTAKASGYKNIVAFDFFWEVQKVSMIDY